MFLENLARILRRDREAVFTNDMAGLDPAIHRSSQELFSKRMDCRVEPGNDEMSPFAYASCNSTSGEHGVAVVHAQAYPDPRHRPAET